MPSAGTKSCRAKPQTYEPDSLSPAQISRLPFMPSAEGTPKLEIGYSLYKPFDYRVRLTSLTPVSFLHYLLAESVHFLHLLRQSFRFGSEFVEGISMNKPDILCEQPRTVSIEANKLLITWDIATPLLLQSTSNHCCSRVSWQALH